MFVGGEFYEDFAWLVQTPAPPMEDAIFLYGGRACLSVISDYLSANKFSRILLPAYLCPSILDVLDQYALNYTFYGINEDFSIDIDDLQKKAENCQAVYFINYFGFRHSPATLSVLNQLQSQGKVLVEDDAQAVLFNNSTSDFCFNSMRKFCACDGGYLATRINISSSLHKLVDIENNRLPLIRIYRRNLRRYLFEGKGCREDLELLFNKAEQFYDKDRVIIGDNEEQKKVETLDWQAIKTVRRSNYDYLLNQVRNIPGVIPLYPTLQKDMMPLGLPVYVSGVSRDHLLEMLANESISLTIHWHGLLSDPRTQCDSRVIKMAEQILTLPVDQYTNRSQMDYLTDQLVRFISILRENKPANSDRAEIL